MFPENGWSYDGCSKCNKKYDTSKSPNKCPGYGKSNPQIVPRFRLEVMVCYKNDSARFILWNRECEQLIKQMSLDLKRQLADEGELDPMVVPEPVDDILSKTLAFKIKVQPNYKRSSVMQLSEDEQLIESIA